MPLWYLQRITKPTRRIEYADGGCFYDTNHAFVIRAATEDAARAIAEQRAGDEPNGIWLEPEFTECDLLQQDGPDRIILVDFNAG